MLHTVYYIIYKKLYIFKFNDYIKFKIVNVQKVTYDTSVNKNVMKTNDE